MDLKKRKERQEIMPDWYVHVVYLPLLLYCGHSLKSLGALMYLKPKTLINVHLSSWLGKFKCLGDVLDSVSLP